MSEGKIHTHLSINVRLECLYMTDKDQKIIILYTPYILWGFYFRKFRESGAIREFNNTRK